MLLGAAAACVILLSFAAEDCTSYWSGCIQAAIVICQQTFAILAPVIFAFKNPFKKCFKIVFFLLWRRDPVLELQFPTPLRVVLLCTKWYWEVFCASFVVQSSTGKCFVQAL